MQRIDLPRNLFFYALSAIVVSAIFIFFAIKYRSYVYEDFLGQQKTRIETSAQIQLRNLDSELQKYSLLPIGLSGSKNVYEALVSASDSNILKLNDELARLAATTKVSFIYVLDKDGVTVASSNFENEDSFIGQSLRFRPYFKEAIDSGASQYFAIGEITGIAGLFIAKRIDQDNEYLGVIVAKVQFEDIIEFWKTSQKNYFIINADGIVLFSSDPELNYTTILNIPEIRLREIYESKQFGERELKPAPIELDDNLFGRDSQGEPVQAAFAALPEYGWMLYEFEATEPVIQAANASIQSRLLTIGIFVVIAMTFVGWRISRRMDAEKTTNMLKTEIALQTKELSEANAKLEAEFSKREIINSRFRKAREELGQANRLGSIGAITAGVAHEINQPVAAIQAFAENTIKFLERQSYERAKQNVNSIIELSSIIGSITHQLRSYASRGKRSTNAVSIKKVIDGVELLIGDRIQAAGVEFVISGNTDSVPEVKADQIRLEQVLVNLLQNALEALIDISNPAIQMTIAANEPWVEILISDNGIGIDEDIAAEVFNPFFSQKPDGLGIGLGIAKDIMAEFGGAIELCDSILGGATFRLRLKMYE